jgi:hypothetical protein
MLARFAAVLILAGLTSTSAIAKNYDEISWKPMQCREPAPPSGLPGDPETPADTMNASVVSYDHYAKTSESYMDCLASEATRDSRTGGQNVSNEAQTMIDAEQKKVIAAGEGFDAKMPAQ